MRSMMIRSRRRSRLPPRRPQLPRRLLLLRSPLANPLLSPPASPLLSPLESLLPLLSLLESQLLLLSHL